MSPISSRNSVPPSACSKRPRRELCAPVNAPRSWPKSSDSSRSFGMAAVLIAMNGPGARGAVPVQRTRDELLAGAGLAGDEHGGARLRQPSDRAKDLLHRGRLAQHLRRAARRRLDRRLRGRFRHRAPDERHGMIDVERLRQVFEGAALEGRDGAVQVRVRGHDDHGKARKALLHLVEEREPRLARHPDVRDEHAGIAPCERLQHFGVETNDSYGMSSRSSAFSRTQRIERSSSTIQTGFITAFPTG